MTGFDGVDSRVRESSMKRVVDVWNEFDRSTAGQESCCWWDLYSMD